MTIVIISLLILLVAIILNVVGKLWLTYYGFRYSPGIGIAVLLVDIATFWFAFYKLEKEGKEWFIAAWLGGAVLAAVTVLAFFGPIIDGVTGVAWTEEYAETHVSGPVDSVLKGSKKTPGATDSPKEEPKDEPKEDEEAPDEGSAPTEDDGATPEDGQAPEEGGDAPAEGKEAPAEGAGDAPADGEKAEDGQAPKDEAP